MQTSGTTPPRQSNLGELAIQEAMNGFALTTTALHELRCMDDGLKSSLSAKIANIAILSIFAAIQTLATAEN